uniref:Uncharacterized protein n=1 Tax=Nelumbo nucifera TaxID=4432 RepID=A0A822YZN0_NELNU|nr:TPA_asm: hypothetical protein HUJ06_005298 [Nelumbo nucifera]
MSTGDRRALSPNYGRPHFQWSKSQTHICALVAYLSQSCNDNRMDDYCPSMAMISHLSKSE